MGYCECGCGKLANKERRFIKGHNIRCFSNTGKHFSEEHKKKISDALKGKKLSVEHKSKLSITHIGKKHSDETKRKIIIGLMGRKCSTETRRKISASHIGLKFSTEHREKLSIFHRKKNSEEHKKKIKISMKEGFLSGRIKRNHIYSNTSIEIVMKNLLQKNNIKYVHQKFIKNIGIVDFFLSDFDTIIECDGNYWHNLEGAKQKDADRDLRASFNGYKTIRLWEKDIKESPEKCAVKILEFIDKH